MILVSACLIGDNCKYNGKNNYNEKVVNYLKDKDYIKCCPEQLGGLSTPRDPSEIKNNKVISNKGVDVTENFKTGAEKTLAIALENKITIAILKAKSPSCGYKKIYDGNFTSTLIEGNGLTADLLEKHNIKILTENDI